MEKYNVHGGHNKIVPGASGILDEVTEDRKVKNAVIQHLKAAGHTAYDCTDDAGTTQSKNLANIVAKCNAHTVTLDISIHLNAGGGTGCEVYYTSDKGKPYAKKVSAAVAKALGIKDRGAKESDSLYVLNHTKSPAILVECCFVDNKTDQKAWNVDKCAKAIVKGITGKSVSGTTSTSSNTSTSSGTTSSSSSTSTSATKLTVDGKWGKSTTKRAQQVFGTTVDGKVSNQYSAYKADNPGLLSESWEWETNPSGYSPLIKAIQKKVGATQDGHIGPKTIKAMQKWLGTTQDGKVSAISPMVKAFQTWLNKQ